MKNNLQEISIDKIKVKENIRSKTKDVASLMSNIKANGLIQAVGVYKENGHYILFQGNRRLEACRKLGWKTIKAEVWDKMDYETMLLLNASENLHRENITVVELGRVCYLLKRKGLTVTEISKRLGYSENRITDSLSVFHKIPAKFREDIKFIDKNASAKTDNIIPISSFSVAMNIINRFQFGQSKIEKLLKFIKENDVPNTKIRLIGQLMNNNYSLEESIKMSKEKKSGRIDVMFEPKVMKKLLVSYDCKTQIEYFGKILSGEISGDKSLLVI